ncbi:thioredoxin [Fragilaria crotonensis]|nr:thioredoxin [Fragilaria crotonensis]
MAKYDELSTKLAKTAGAASFSFSARELSDSHGRAAGSTGPGTWWQHGRRGRLGKVVRSLISGVIREPYSMKFRRINLQNKGSILGGSVPAVSCNPKECWFRDGSEWECNGGRIEQKVVNVSPLSVARDCVDKWIDKNRHTVAADLRKRKDEEGE